MIAAAAATLLSYASTFFNFGRRALEALQGYDYLATHNTKSVQLLFWLFSPQGAQLLTLLFLAAFFVAVIRTFRSFQHLQQATVQTTPPALQESPKSGAEKLSESTPKAKPNLVLIRTRLAHVDFDYGGATPIKLEMSHMSESNAALVEFGNEIGAEGSPAKITDLRARITFYDEVGNYYHRVKKGWWVAERFPFINLDVGETAELILLHRINGNFGDRKVLRYHIEENLNDEPEMSEHKPTKWFDGPKFRAQIVLVYGPRSEVIGTYDIDLTLEPVFEVKAATPKPPPLS